MQHESSIDLSVVEQVQRSMIGHGVLIMLMALVAGLGLWMSLLGGFEIVPGYIFQFDLPGTPEGWARAHRGTPLNALMVIVVALAMPKVGLSAVSLKRIGWILIWTGWANTLFYFASNFSGNRGLSFGSNSFGAGDLAGAIALAPAYLFGVLSMGALFYLGWAALRKRG